MESSFHFPSDWKGSLDTQHRLSVASVETLTRGSNSSSETTSFVNVSRSNSFSPPSSSDWPSFTPSLTGDTSPRSDSEMNATVLAGFNHPSFSTSDVIMRLDPDNASMTSTRQATPIQIPSPPRQELASESIAYGVSEDTPPGSPVHELLEQTLSEPTLFFSNASTPEQPHMLLHSSQATPHSQLSPQPSSEIRVIPPSEPPSTPAHSQRYTSPSAFAIDRSFYESQELNHTSPQWFPVGENAYKPQREEQADTLTMHQLLQPMSKRSRSLVSSTPDSRDFNHANLTPPTFKDLTSPTYNWHRSPTERRKTQISSPARDLDELANRLLNSSIGNTSSVNPSRPQVTVEEEEDEDALRPPLRTTVSASCAYTGSFPITAAKSYSPTKLVFPQPPTNRNEKAENNGYLRAVEPGWKRVPPSQPQLSPLSFSPVVPTPQTSAGRASANKSRDIWMPNPSYVSSPPTTVNPIVTMQHRTKEDRPRNGAISSADIHDAPQSSRILSRHGIADSTQIPRGTRQPSMVNDPDGGQVSRLSRQPSVGNIHEGGQAPRSSGQTSATDYGKTFRLLRQPSVGDIRDGVQASRSAGLSSMSNVRDTGQLSRLLRHPSVGNMRDGGQVSRSSGQFSTTDVRDGGQISRLSRQSSVADVRDGGQSSRLSRQPSFTTPWMGNNNSPYDPGSTSKGKERLVSNHSTQWEAVHPVSVAASQWPGYQPRTSGAVSPISEIREPSRSENESVSPRNFYQQLPSQGRPHFTVEDDRKKVPAPASYCQFVNSLPGSSVGSAVPIEQHDRNGISEGNPHIGSVRFSNMQIEHPPRIPTASGGTQSSNFDDFKQPLTAQRLNYMTPMSSDFGTPMVPWSVYNNWNLANRNNMMRGMSAQTQFDPTSVPPFNTFSANPYQFKPQIHSHWEASIPSTHGPMYPPYMSQPDPTSWGLPQGLMPPWEPMQAGGPGNYRVPGSTIPNDQPRLTYGLPSSGWDSHQPRNDMHGMQPVRGPDLKLKKHPEFWMEGVEDATVWIRLGSVDYHLPARIFLKNSQFFKLILWSHAQSGDTGPVILQGVDNWQFECLLRVFYPSHDPSLDLTTTKQWENVLEVMDMWGFSPKLKEHALSKLDLYASAADRIYIGRLYKKPSWVKRGLIELCRRSDALTVEECRRIGPEDTARIMQLQFARHVMIPQAWTVGQLTLEILQRFDLDDNFAIRDADTLI